MNMIANLLLLFALFFLACVVIINYQTLQESREYCSNKGMVAMQSVDDRYYCVSGELVK